MFQLQGVITVEPGGSTAYGRWYGMGMEAKPVVSLHEGELRQTWIHGIYENTYVKEDGVWKFKKLHFNLVFRTPFEDGWLKVPVVGQHGPDRDHPARCRADGLPSLSLRLSPARLVQAPGHRGVREGGA